MSKEERPLPRPPVSPFGGKRRFEEREEDVNLMADRMASAVAEGKLEEFLQKELPDNEHAKTLARMMLGMSGMLPPEGLSAPSPSPSPPPEEIVRAAGAGDVKALMELLKREQAKRASSPEDVEEQKEEAGLPDLTQAQRETIEQIVRIASENDVTFDWLALRAFKRYIEEYRRTGLL